MAATGVRVGRAVAGLALLVALLAPATAPTREGADIRMSGISGSPDAPRRHFRLKDPADLAPAGAEDVYRILVKALRTGYARAGLDVGAMYQDWRRFNRTPYLSSTHGNHYINNYANGRARDYGRYEAAGPMPVGSVIAKDSFSVTSTGGLLLGPLFVMEKMPAGFSPASGDWRYTLIQPDGTVLGTTHGYGSKRVEYCIACHLAVEHQDHLFFLPDAYRVHLP